MTRKSKLIANAIAAHYLMLCLFLVGPSVTARAQAPVFPTPPVGVARPPIFVPAPSSPPFGSSPAELGQVFQGPLILSPRLGLTGATVLTPNSVLGLARPPPDGSASTGPDGNCGLGYPIPHARLTCR